MAIAKPTPDYTRIVTEESSATKQLVNPYLVRKAEHSDLVALASEVQRADEEVRHVASGKLQVIAEQIRFLQEQARRVLEDAKESADLHSAKCNFVKKPGNIYFLYERSSGQSYFSMISPEEWIGCPHTFLAAYRLEHDRSWTKLADIPKKDKELKIIDNLMNHGGLPSLECFTSMSENKQLRIEENIEK